MSCEGFIGPQLVCSYMKQLIKNSIRSFFCKQFCIELVLKVQIRCAAGSVPDGLQMTLKLEGNLTSQQKERLLQVSGTRLIQLVYSVTFTCIYFGHCFMWHSFIRKMEMKLRIKFSLQEYKMFEHSGHLYAQGDTKGYDIVDISLWVLFAQTER
jgi:hypothetical protein